MCDSQPLISICIANYNGEQIIEACLDSIKNQDLAEGIEVIVHDDASSDASLQIIEQRFPNVKLLRSVENVGFCKANNRMVQVARGDYILLLNNDTVLWPDALRTLQEHAQSCGGHRILTLPQYDIDSRQIIDVGRRIDCSLNPVPRRQLETCDVAMCIGACLWIPRQLWNELGGFPEWFGSIGEDLFLCLLAWRAGYGVTAIGASGYYHHVGYSFGGSKPDNAPVLSSSLRRRRLSEVNRTRTMAILLPRVVRWFALPIHLAGLLVEGLVMLVVRRDRRLWSGLYRVAILTPFRDQGPIREERARLKEKFSAPFSRLVPQIDWIPYKVRMLLRHGLPRIDD